VYGQSPCLFHHWMKYGPSYFQSLV